MGGRARPKPPCPSAHRSSPGHLRRLRAQISLDHGAQVIRFPQRTSANADLLAIDHEEITRRQIHVIAHSPMFRYAHEILAPHHALFSHGLRWECAIRISRVRMKIAFRPVAACLERIGDQGGRRIGTHLPELEREIDPLL